MAPGWPTVVPKAEKMSNGGSLWRRRPDSNRSPVEELRALTLDKVAPGWPLGLGESVDTARTTATMTRGITVPVSRPASRLLAPGWPLEEH